MMLTQAKVGGGREERGPAGRTTKGRTGSAATTAKVIPMDGKYTKGPQSDPSGIVGGANPVVVIFRMRDGSCGEGITRHVGSDAMFIESKRMVPVGTEVTIRLTQSNEGLGDWGTTEGVVIWTCPSVDQFNNGQGFGVCLQGRWPQPRQAAEPEGHRGRSEDT